MRMATVERNTSETKIKLELELDGAGEYKVDTGCGFLNHMLELFTKHGGFNLGVLCRGDVEVDYHHTAEDIGIALGLAFREALGEKLGIKRYASIILPMDEALILSAVDISGRGYYASALDIRSPKVGDFDTELVDEFWQAFAANAGITLHVRQLAGVNSHHIIEGVFKSVARALREAVATDERFKDTVPSTKGSL